MNTIANKPLFQDIDIQESVTTNGGNCPTYRLVLVWNPWKRRYEYRMRLVICGR